MQIMNITRTGVAADGDSEALDPVTNTGPVFIGNANPAFAEFVCTLSAISGATVTVTLVGAQDIISNTAGSPVHAPASWYTLGTFQNAVTTNGTTRLKWSDIGYSIPPWIAIAYLVAGGTVTVNVRGSAVSE